MGRKWKTENYTLMSDIEHNDYCRKEGELASVRTELTDLKKIVKGNGQKGLQQIVTELNTKIPPLTEAVDGLSKKVQQLLDKDIAVATERALKMSAKQKLIAIYGGIIGFVTVAVMIADMLINK